jgi:hypothetical protein
LDVTALSVNVAEMAEMYSVHRNTVVRWLEDGLPSTDPAGGALSAGRLIHLVTGVRWVRDHYAAKHEAVVEKFRAKIEGGAKERKLEAEARIKEIDAAEREKRVVSMADVEAALMAEADATREAMLGVSRDAVQTGLIPPAQEAAPQDLIRAALISLSQAPVHLAAPTPIRPPAVEEEE